MKLYTSVPCALSPSSGRIWWGKGDRTDHATLWWHSVHSVPSPCRDKVTLETWTHGRTHQHHYWTREEKTAENSTTQRGKRFLPLSCRKSIEKCSNTAPFSHHSWKVFRILKIAPFLFPNTRFFTFKQHLSVMWCNCSTAVDHVTQLIYYTCSSGKNSFLV